MVFGPQRDPSLSLWYSLVWNTDQVPTKSCHPRLCSNDSWACRRDGVTYDSYPTSLERCKNSKRRCQANWMREIRSNMPLFVPFCSLVTDSLNLNILNLIAICDSLWEERRRGQGLVTSKITSNPMMKHYWWNTISEATAVDPMRSWNRKFFRKTRQLQTRSAVSSREVWQMVEKKRWNSRHWVKLQNERVRTCIAKITKEACPARRSGLLSLPFILYQSAFGVLV